MIYPMEEITGYVEGIIFRNSDNGYTVMDFVVDEFLITVVGIFPTVGEGENLLLRGQYIDHPTYGRQFKATSYEAVAPADELSMERYLGSGAIRGIGPKLAARIVKKFGADTFRLIEEEPERLAEVKGISLNKAMEISDQIVGAKDIRNAMIFLDKYGLHGNTAIKIYNRFGNEVYNIIQSNPYKLADEISGIGFKTADEIATQVGIKVDSEFRIKGGIQYILGQGAGLGHTYLPIELLKDMSVDLLKVDEASVEAQIMNLAMERKLIIKKDGDNTQIYSRAFFRMEESIAGMLRELNVTYKADEADLQKVIRRIEKDEEIELDELQKNAVISAAKKGFFILTGGPGTGKTTTITTMIRMFEEEGLNIFLGAPTGRAAKRMSEATGYEARTIHRMLEVSGRLGDDDDVASFARFDRNEENPLECDVIIIDEMSMVDVSLMYSLLKAISPGTRLILVGDVNQLPSVGPGNVLKDILASDKFESVKLEKIFRQAQESDIVMNAHKIHQGQHVLLDNKSKDFFFLKRDDADTIISVMLTLVKEKMPKYVDAGISEIQVLTPTRKGLLGVERLNSILQRYLNPESPDKKEWKGDTRVFREGDKVMQIRNNYQLEWEVTGNYNITIEKGLGVFNGDVGIIKDINEWGKTVTVEFEEGRKVVYPFASLDELELAYAITVHKSQGSEYPAVVMPIVDGPKMLMNRNILYTAITRAKKCVTMVGDADVFYSMVDNTSQAKRYSGLKDRIAEAFRE
ncbi:ATP-dependent RecD-like DNA helicase [Pseudobutyrivibrio xylanivorans]|uniref:ATP-dependent RecD2 DNA helicase n=3 Tax=Lachnospiraceae TaxID=186803 RepID=A0A2G3ED73_9FIRM|nr:ATP-dependent RecD-like DNA helicase [Pseudobutyrivibrio xylanivorans]PHU33811.1 ATP-dependent RecD-like DNA helicase [Pseudobutyrivibrio ruminis]PHU41085.1 ATP-dependent RecD-like DNA helicase [Pseudobutyrivibrio ruminis]